ncbi:MAG TPA: tetratricopeptide repeat protein [Candidatus Acidoferrum sp.]|nr:tetratricopeptide repeat protein [Candidatus Acidoferrum sp.]
MKTALPFLLAAVHGWGQLQLAEAHRLRGEYAAAEREYLRLAGETGPETGTALSGLAMLYLETGRLAEAESVARRVLALERARSGPHSAEAGYALGLLGSALSRMQRHDEAQRELREAVRIAGAALGAEHPQTARLRANLAAAMIAGGRTSAAEPLLRSAEFTLRAVLGEGHMEVAILRHNLGTLYLQQKRLALAESELTAALHSWERLLGERSPYYVQTANLLVRTRCIAKESASASRLLARVLPLAEDLFGPDHPETARARLSQATLEFERGQIASAERWARRALESQKDRLPAIRDEFLEELTFYGAVLSRLGEPAGAKRVQRWSRHIRRTPASSELSAYIRQQCPTSL